MAVALEETEETARDELEPPEESLVVGDEMDGEGRTGMAGTGGGGGGGSFLILGTRFWILCSRTFTRLRISDTICIPFERVTRELVDALETSLLPMRP